MDTYINAFMRMAGGERDRLAQGLQDARTDEQRAGTGADLGGYGNLHDGRVRDGGGGSSPPPSSALARARGGARLPVPWIIGFAIFTLAPMIASLYWSFTKYQRRRRRGGSAP
jgi:hypothetical protein